MEAAHSILGYWNLSDGADDVGFLRAFDHWARGFVRDGHVDWEEAQASLSSQLAALAGSGPFGSTEQAEAVLAATFRGIPSAYRRFHADLLHARTDGELWTPFAAARASQAVIRQGGPWDEADRIVEGALAELNSFLGYRPVAVLQNGRRCEPYAHERVAPIPLYLAGAGVGWNPYEEIVAAAIELLHTAPEDVARAAGFDWPDLDELALDPREYDFDHPAHQRPNHLFGEWDPDVIDGAGGYTRFVVRRQLLDAIAARSAPNIPREELVFEAAAATAGVILMASGMTLGRPDGHDSSVTLGKLTPRIAAYRDEFYESLLRRLSAERPEHYRRLEEERRRLNQPFAGIRQHLNRELAERRAAQHSAAQLAQLFDRIGRPEAAVDAAAEAAPALRMTTIIRGKTLAASRAAQRGDAINAQIALAAAEDLIDRAIECGALVDPWNLLGFQGNFSIFPAIENTIPDPRIEVLVELTRAWFAAGVGVWAAAASRGEASTVEQVAEAMRERAAWWDRFATLEAAGGAGFSAERFVRSGERTSAALTAWLQESGAAGDVAFWRPHVMDFKSGQSFARIARVLLDRNDFIASMALLMQWLNQGEDLDGANRATSFYGQCRLWMERLYSSDELADDEKWRLAVKFIDYLEANGEEYWQAPRLAAWMPDARARDAANHAGEEELDEGDEIDDLFAAAYEDVVYRDSTDDGFEGETLDGGGSSPTTYELDAEARDLRRRFAFLRGLAELLRAMAVRGLASDAGDCATCEVADRFADWRRRIHRIAEKLLDTLTDLAGDRAAPALATAQAMIDFDRARRLREELQEQAADTIVDLRDAAVHLHAAALHLGAPAMEAADDDALDRLLVALWRRDAATVDAIWTEATVELAAQPLLYLPLPRGGRPDAFVEAKRRLRAMEQLLTALAEQGMLARCGETLDLAMHMERAHRVSSGSYTEFDRLFFGAAAGIARCVVRATQATPEASAREMTASLDAWNQSLLTRWLAHSQGLRLSAVERFSDSKTWRELKSFVQEYGRDLFTQQFLGIGNLRFIRHVGPEAYLERLEQLGEEEAPRLLDAVENEADRRDFARKLGYVADAVLENYLHYREYNATTTASDRGDLLYILLDFLRLLAAYDRIAWNLAPVAVIHEVLTDEREHAAAELWRQAMIARTADAAAEHLKRYDRLCGEYGVQVHGVRQRLAERFVQPLMVHRMRPLLRTVLSASGAESDEAFDGLQAEIEELQKESRSASGGPPAWLVQLEREAVRISEQDEGASSRPSTSAAVQDPPTLEQLQQELTEWLESEPPWQ